MNDNESRGAGPRFAGKIIYISIAVLLAAGGAAYYFMSQRKIPWSEAQAHFQKCEVKEVEKRGQSEVVIYLKNSKTVKTEEPAKNEVFAEIAKNFMSCGPIFEKMKN
jgi:hypothetical protein